MNINSDLELRVGEDRPCCCMKSPCEAVHRQPQHSYVARVAYGRLVRGSDSFRYESGDENSLPRSDPRPGSYAVLLNQCRVSLSLIFNGKHRSLKARDNPNCLMS